MPEISAKLEAGDRCRVAWRDDPENAPTVYKLLDGIIQEIRPNGGEINVFIYGWGERHFIPAEWVLELEDHSNFSANTIRNLISEGLPPPVPDARVQAMPFEMKHGSPQQREANRIN